MRIAHTLLMMIICHHLASSISVSYHPYYFKETIFIIASPTMSPDLQWTDTEHFNDSPVPLTSSFLILVNRVSSRSSHRTHSGGGFDLMYIHYRIPTSLGLLIPSSATTHGTFCFTWCGLSVSLNLKVVYLLLLLEPLTEYYTLITEQWSYINEFSPFKLYVLPP